jgi:methylated-DNA-[protein]-cysteine S-methyltransferase
MQHTVPTESGTPDSVTDELSITTMDSPVGTLTLAASRVGLRAVLWPGELDGRIRLGSVGDGGADADEILDRAVSQLREYFEGSRRDFDVPLDPVGTEFQRQAWAVLRTIPFGHTMTYGEQAGRLGDPNKSRAVGAANGRNPISIIVPCHRVIGSTGKLTGFAGGLDNKAWLLRHERGDELPFAPATRT